MRSVSLVVASFLLAGTLAADPDSKVEIRNKSRDLSRVHEELQQKKAERERLLREAGELSKKLETDQSRMHDLETTLLHIKEKNQEIEESMAHAKNLRDRTAQKISTTESAVREAFGTHYVMAALTDPVAPNTVLTRQLYRRNVVKLSDMNQQKEDQEQSFLDITASYQVIQHQVNNQQQNLEQLRNGYENQQRLLQKKMTRRQVLDQETRDLEKTEEELASLIDLLRSKAKQEQETEKKARAERMASGKSPIAINSLPWPAKGTVIEKFGRQKNPASAAHYISNGITIRFKQRVPINAVADGTVLYAGNFMSYGLMVLVEHPGDWYSVYGQLGGCKVDKGQSIKKGDALGEAGLSDAGWPTMYFELRFYGKPVDPQPWLDNSSF